jgi:hypothetical protein
MVQAFVVINQDYGTQGQETNLSFKSEFINPLIGHEARRKFPTTQVHTILWEVGVKLDISGFQGYLQPKEPLVKKERKVQQKEGA